jgi:hypothetical protein
MDLDGQDYPKELVERADKLIARVATHNKARFGN